MNHKRPKIWQTEDQIIAAIDRTRRFAAARLKQSKELDEAAKIKFGKCEALRFEMMKPMSELQAAQLQAKLGAAELSAGSTKEKADAAARMYHRAMNKTLTRLGEVLAAFRTGTFKEVLGDYKTVAVK